MDAEFEEPPTDDGEPPVGGSWRRLYTFLIVELVVLTALFYALTRWAA